MKKQRPDYEMEVMRRGLRLIEGLSHSGRRRVLAYWGARIEGMEPAAEQYGAQQLDIEDIPTQLPVRVAGGAQR